MRKRFLAAISACAIAFSASPTIAEEMFRLNDDQLDATTAGALGVVLLFGAGTAGLIALYRFAERSEDYIVPLEERTPADTGRLFLDAGETVLDATTGTSLSDPGGIIRSLFQLQGSRLPRVNLKQPDVCPSGCANLTIQQSAISLFA